MKSGAAGEVVAEPRLFATTRWTVILSATGRNGTRRLATEALAELCRTYWRPVFVFLSRQGFSPQEAQDLTQDFFVMILETDWLQQADEHRGRFRSFLLKSLQNFVGQAQERRRAIKRGGRFDFISWDEWLAETPSDITLPEQITSQVAPERLFDLRWAATIVERALQRLREECEGKGRLRLFETLRIHLGSERGDVSYASLAGTLGIAETIVKKQLHNLRERYRWFLRDEVAQTLSSPAEVEDEIRYLCGVLAAAQG